MAKQTVQIVTCDMCGSEGAKPFVLVGNPRRGRASGRSLDLCPEHSAPIREMIEKGRRVSVMMETESLAPIGRRAPRPAASSRKVYTEKELDALERREKKK